MEPPAGVAPQLGELIIIVSPISRTTDSTHITVSPQVSRNFLVSPRVTQLSRLETQTKHPVFTERHVSLSSRNYGLLHSNYSPSYYQWGRGYSKVVAGKRIELLNRELMRLPPSHLANPRFKINQSAFYTH